VLARARRVPRQLFAPEEPCGACHQAGEGLGRDTAKREVREDQEKGEVVVVETLPSLSQSLRGYPRASRVGAPVLVPGECPI
jgi:hypothetical protein